MLEAADAIQIRDLRVDGRYEPLTIAGMKPELQWRLSGPENAPTHVRIQAATTPDHLASGTADIWDSGAMSYSLPRVVWNGPALTSGQSVHWRVGVALDNTFVWSEPATFGVALLDPADWNGGKWITHPSWSTGGNADGLPMVETAFTAPPIVHNARLFIAAGGVLSVTINGRPAAAEVLAPGYAVYSKRVPALAWDVGALLVPGRTNVVRIEIGTGVAWVPATSRYTKFIAEDLLPRVLVRLAFPDGDQDVVSGAHWKSALTATRTAHWFGGEDHDGRESDHDIQSAKVLGDPSTHDVWWSEQPGLRVVEIVEPVAMTRHDDGTRVVDFGCNVAGWPVITLAADSGTAIEMWPGEILDSAGKVNQKTTGTPLYDTYVTRAGTQTWHPRFVYHGFRYLEVRGLAEHDPDPRFEAQIIRANNARAGTFTTDDDYLATLDRLIDRAIQGNMYSVFTDCPNREKLGWVEQLYLCFDALARNYDVQAHLRDEIVHMSDSQLRSGSIPSIAPESVDFSDHEFNGDANAFRDDPNWGGAIAFVPWRLYENYGDVRALEMAWPNIRRYVAYLVGREIDGIVDFGLGDWIAIDTSTPRAMVATFGYLRVLETAAAIAGVLGEPNDYAARSDRVRAAFAARFSGAGDSWGSGSQGSYALALDSGAVSADRVPVVRERLLETIATAGGRISAGENAWPSMMRVLHEMGRDDVTSALVRNDDGPGYAWQVKHGATALAESWFGATGAANDNSQNHFMLAMVHDWMTQVVGGLAQHPDSVGWARALIEPTPVQGVGSMRVSYDSPVGEYIVDWRQDRGFELEVTVPPGGSATVVLPGSRDCHDVQAGTWRFSS